MIKWIKKQWKKFTDWVFLTDSINEKKTKTISIK